MTEEFYNRLRLRQNEVELGIQKMINYLRTAKELTSDDITNLSADAVELRRKMQLAQGELIDEMERQR